MTQTTLKLDEIVKHKALQAPDRTNRDHVADLKEAVEKKEELPRIQVIEVEGMGYLLVDGHHTYDGFVAAGRKTIAATVRKGTFEDAVLAAAKANQKHLGLKRSHKTKRWAVMSVLGLHSDWSDARIAKEVGVSANMVGDCRKDLPKDKQTAKRVGADGKTRKAKPEQKHPRTPSEALAGKAAEAKAEKESESPTVTQVKAFNWSQHDQCFGFLKRGLEALQSLTGDRDAVKKADAALNAYLKHADELRQLANGMSK
jgi:hypothetical protein